MRKILFYCCLSLPCGCHREPRSVADIRAADVESLEVFVENRRDRGPAIGPVLVSEDDYERILILLRDAMEERRPAKWQALGWVKIRMRKGETFLVDLFWTGGKEVAYRIGRTYYRACSDAEFIRVLAGCAGRTSRAE